VRAICLLACVACSGGGSKPTPTEAVCPDPDPMSLTYDNFGRDFAERYCVACHSSTLPRSQRNGAPLFHDFDSLIGMVQVANHIDEEAGFGPAAENEFMPPERCPSTPGGSLDIDCPRPTDQERRDLAAWLACEINRPH
jgi:hypothetical protein